MITHSAKEAWQQKEKLGWGLEVKEKWGRGGAGQNLNKGWGLGKKKEAFNKITGLPPLYQPCKETLKISYPSIIKPTPHSWLPLSPIPSKNFPSPPLQPSLENFITPFMKEGGLDYEYLC